jgi:phospholipid transport system substrate-binding protein
VSQSYAEPLNSKAGENAKVSKAQKSFAYSSDPVDFITEIVRNVSTVLASTNTSEYKTEKLAGIALKTFDIEGVAKHSLGTHFKELNDEQLAEYYKLFKKYFLKSFTSSLTDDSEKKIQVVSVEVKNKKYTIVKSLLHVTNKKPEIEIEWRVYTKNPDKPLIRDLIIEGVSLAETQRVQSVSVIQSNNGDVTKLFIPLTELTDK